MNAAGHNEALRSRWISNPHFADIRNSIYATVDMQGQYFVKKNRKRIDRFGYRDPAKKKWGYADYPRIFRKMLDVSDKLASMVPKIKDHAGGDEYIDLRGIHMDHPHTFTGLVLHGVDFSYATSEGMNFMTHCQLYKCIFDAADLDAALFGYYFENCRFIGTNLTKLYGDYSCFLACRFQGCKMGGMSTRRGYHVESSFADCDLRNSALGTSIRSTFQNCNFRRADICAEHFVDCRFENCDFAHVPGGFNPLGY